MTGEVPRPEPVHEEFAAWREEFLDHLLPEDMPEDEKDLFRSLR